MGKNIINDKESDVIKKEKNSNKKKLVIIFVLILAIITSVSGFAIYKHISNEKLAQEQAEKELNEKLEKCYVAINDNYNFDEFKEVISTIQEKNDKSKAYNKLSEALENLINNLYDNFDVETNMKLFKFFQTMEEDETLDEELKEIIKTKDKCRSCEGYIYQAERHIENGEFTDAYICYSSAIRDISGIDTEKRQSIVEKREKIKSSACELFKNKLKEKIGAKDYSEYLSTYENLVNESDDDELKSVYNQYLTEQSELKKTKEKEKKKKEGVYIGMTKQQVLDSMWGEPIKINTTTTRYGVNEQWVYPNNNYLYFENGKLTAIQN